MQTLKLITVLGALSLFTHGAPAQEARPEAPSQRSGLTKEQKVEQRAPVKAGAVEARTAGQVSSSAAEEAANHPKKAAGTHESRSAERKQKRAEVKESGKKGEIPKVGEGGTSKP